MNARLFHQNMALGYFKPIYPVIAENMLRESGCGKGRCIDLGGGTGVLAVELARQSALELTIIDPNPECLKIATEYVLKCDMQNRVHCKWGRAESIPWRSNDIDLVVSRGSVFFWDDFVAGINEVFRILRPGGFACIGGGMGTTRLKRQITAQLSENKEWNRKRRERFRKNMPVQLNHWMCDTIVPYWEMVCSDEGSWIEFRKDTSNKYIYEK